MRQKLIILLTIYLLFNSALSAQNIEKMNKSELREHIVILTTKIDSLKKVNTNLQESISKLTANSSLLEQKNKTNEAEFSRINELILKNENESKRIISENTTKIDSLKKVNTNLQESISKLSANSSLLEQKNKTNEVEILRINELILKNENVSKQIISENKIAISKLNEIIITLKDSISNVQSSSNVVSTSTTFNKNDFLNKYYFDQIPLPNNSFSLVLSKLVYENKRSDNNYNDNYNDNDNDDNYQRAVERLPEILEANAFTYWGVKPNVMITSGTNISNYVISKNSDYFNSKLPKIEVLKNKLFTIKYNDGSEESFLFNVKQIKSEDNNNQRKILQIELANEEVKEDGSNNTAKDIVWRFFAIENECYLALTVGQLNRLNLKLISVDKGLEAYSENRQTIEFTTYFEGYYKQTTTGEGIYLSRKKDSFMNSSEYIDPKEIIYLFKLK